MEHSLHGKKLHMLFHQSYIHRHSGEQWSANLATIQTIQVFFFSLSLFRRLNWPLAIICLSLTLVKITPEMKVMHWFFTFTIFCLKYDQNDELNEIT